MWSRWSFGVVVAIIVAISVATSSGARPAPVRHAAAPVEVTLALEPQGATLRISHDAFAVTLTF